MEFTPWNLFTDLGLIFLLLTLGKLLRAKVKPVQVLFLPASIIAGLLALLFGPNGFGIIPFSDQISTYPSILIAVIFASLPLGQTFDLSSIAGRVGALFSYSLAMYVMMWGAGLLFALAVLGLIWDLPGGFGLMLASGFVGGHGTAAAVGSAFEGLGWQEAQSLAFTSATVGVVVAILGGLALTQWGARTNRTTILADFKDLPVELRTGLIPRQRRESIGEGTVSPVSLEPLALHLGLILMAATGAYYLAQGGEALLPQLAIPVFAVAYIVGIILQFVLVKMRADEYVDKDTINDITGTSTDLLVAFGIAAIVPTVVASYLIPLILLLLFGIGYCLVLFRFLAPRMFSEYAFERGIFTWGWSTGAVAMGIALLRIVDPKLESKTLDDYGLAYVPIAPVEVAMVSFAPFLIASGLSWPFIAVTIGGGIAVLAIAKFAGWWGVGSSFKDSST